MTITIFGIILAAIFAGGILMGLYFRQAKESNTIPFCFLGSKIKFNDEYYAVSLIEYNEKTGEYSIEGEKIKI